MSKKKIEFPECWEEVLPSEWIYLLKLREQLIQKKGITLNDIKSEWCRFALKNRGIRASQKVDYYLLIYNLSLTLDWMWKEDSDRQSVALTFDSTQNLLPTWKNLRGPLSHGNDMTFGEFRTAVGIMNSYMQSQDPAMLQALCGILYRKPGKKVGKENFNGHYREPFNPARIPFYAERVRLMPTYIQWGIYTWFAYFCHYLMTGVFIIEGNEVCFAPIFRRENSHKKKTSEQSLGMNSILFSVAESGIFGNADSTDNTLLLKIMLKLLDDYQRAKAMTTKSKKP